MLQGTFPLDFDEEEQGREPAIEHDTPETLLLERSSHESFAIDELLVHFREILLLCEV